MAECLIFLLSTIFHLLTITPNTLNQHNAGKITQFLEILHKSDTGFQIIDPQSAVLTNVEVLAYLTANPPRRSPNPPPNADRLWVPSPDLRDHNTVVKEVSSIKPK